MNTEYRPPAIPIIMKKTTPAGDAVIDGIPNQNQIGTKIPRMISETPIIILFDRPDGDAGTTKDVQNSDQNRYDEIDEYLHSDTTGQGHTEQERKGGNDENYYDSHNHEPTTFHEDYFSVSLYTSSVDFVGNQ
jgi:hypothetical protein